MPNHFMVVETTNLYGSACFSMQSDADIPNGAIVGKGELLPGETDIYTALTDYSGGMYLAANPACLEEEAGAAERNEENYRNKAGIPFRTYRLSKDMKFKVSNLSGAALAEGDYVTYADGAYVKADTATALKVVRAEPSGFPYFICSGNGTVNGLSPAGPEAGAEAGTYRYTIEVIA